MIAPNLQTISEEVLIKELLSRYEYAAFIGMKPDIDKTDKIDGTWKGHIIMLMGLVTHLTNQLIKAQNPR